jgi:hypothetical protein
MIGLAARFPDLRDAASAGATAPELRRRFQLSLDEDDAELLRSITDEEVSAFEQELHAQFADVYPFGI